MQKLLSITGLLCGAIFAVVIEASEQQKKVVDIYATFIEMSFVGQSGMTIPGSVLNTVHFKMSAQDDGRYPSCRDIADNLEHYYPGCKVTVSNNESCNDYFAYILLDLKLSYAAQLRKRRSREIAYSLSINKVDGSSIKRF